MSKITELGMGFTRNAEECCLQRTNESNVQVLHAKFKKDVENYVRSYAKMVTPKLDNLIEKKKHLKNVLNNKATDLAEKQMLAGALIDAPLIPAGFWSFLQNPEESNLAETPAKMTFRGTNIPVE